MSGIFHSLDFCFSCGLGFVPGPQEQNLMSFAVNCPVVVHIYAAHCHKDCLQLEEEKEDDDKDEDAVADRVRPVMRNPVQESGNGVFRMVRASCVALESTSVPLSLFVIWLCTHMPVPQWVYRTLSRHFLLVFHSQNLLYLLYAQKHNI